MFKWIKHNSILAFNLLLFVLCLTVWTYKLGNHIEQTTQNIVATAKIEAKAKDKATTEGETETAVTLPACAKANKHTDVRFKHVKEYTQTLVLSCGETK